MCLVVLPWIPHALSVEAPSIREPGPVGLASTAPTVVALLEMLGSPRQLVRRWSVLGMLDVVPI